jgi:hypothetical protein
VKPGLSGAGLERMAGLVEHRKSFNHSCSDESNSNEKRLHLQALTFLFGIGTLIRGRRYLRYFHRP